MARPGEVRRHHGVRKIEKRILRIRGFLLENIDAGRGDFPFPERVNQRRLIDYRATRAVHENRGFFHHPKPPGIKHVARLGRQTAMNRYEIGFARQPAQFHRLHARLADRLIAHERVIRQYAALKTRQQPGQFPPDVPETYDAERRPAHLVGDPDALTPAPFSQLFHPLWNPAARGQHQAQGRFRDGDRVRARAVRHRDSSPRGGGYVDILNAHANLGDELQACASLDHPLGDLLSRRHQQGVPFMGIAHQFVFGPFPVAAVTKLAIRLQHVSQRFDGRARLGHENHDVAVQ